MLVILYIMKKGMKSALIKNEPCLVGEVIRDLINNGELLPNYKRVNYER